MRNDARGGVAGERFEDCVLRLVVLQVGEGNREWRAGFGAIDFRPGESGQLAGMTSWQRIQDDRVEHCEDSRVGPNSERKSQDDETDEDRALAHAAQSVAEVAPAAAKKAAEPAIAGRHGVAAG